MRWFAFFSIPALVAISAPASAVTITFQATDLADVVQGEDLWQYAYTVQGFSHAAGHGFSILFDPSLYEALENPPPAVSPDWDIIALQPDVLLPDPGRYDAQALVDQPDLTPAFTVNFIFLGTGAPGPQAYEVYDPSFQAIELGVTVPEPGSFLLALAAALAIFHARRLGRKSRLEVNINA